MSRPGTPMAPEALQSWRRRLSAERRLLFDTSGAAEEDLRALETAPSDPPPSRSTREETTERLAALLEASQRPALHEIEAAFERLEAGSFGRCEGCGVEIPTARLEEAPTVRFCVECEATKDDPFAPGRSARSP